MGTPQGCCLSPTLFMLYTNDCRASQADNTLSKFAEDSALVGLVTGYDDSQYRLDMDRLVEWCLDLNVGKTKEMVTDFRRPGSAPEPLTIGDQVVEQVDEYKYLGVTVSSDISWTKHVGKVVSKCHSRLHFLRKLRQFKVNNEILTSFYRASIESVLSFNLTTWLHGCNEEDRDRLRRVVRQAERVVGSQLPSIEELECSRTVTKACKIAKDELHPLHGEFQMLPSGRRYRAAKCRTNRFQQMFVPSAITLLNEQLK